MFNRGAPVAAFCAQSVFYDPVNFQTVGRFAQHQFDRAPTPSLTARRLSTVLFQSGSNGRLIESSRSSRRNVTTVLMTDLFERRRPGITLRHQRFGVF